MNRLNPLLAGGTLSVLAMLAHAVWAVFVAAGLAQPVIDFIFRLHFIEPVYRVVPFDPATAALLLALSGIGGFTIGAVLAIIWNALAPSRSRPVSRVRRTS